MIIMFDMGFDPYNIWVSLQNCKFDKAMATYLILRHPRTKGVGCTLQAKRGPLGGWASPRPQGSSQCLPQEVGQSSPWKILSRWVTEAHSSSSGNPLTAPGLEGGH